MPGSAIPTGQVMGRHAVDGAENTTYVQVAGRGHGQRVHLVGVTSAQAMRAGISKAPYPTPTTAIPTHYHRKRRLADLQGNMATRIQVAVRRHRQLTPPRPAPKRK
jgi:hypothetical protein